MCSNVEMGWNVARWIPTVRHKSRKYDRTICIVPPGFDYLVEDFADEIINYSTKTTGDKWIWTDDPKTKVPEAFILKHPGSRIFEISLKRCNKESNKEYVLYGTDMPECGYDLVVHARQEAKWGRTDRNWPLKNYVELLKTVGNPRAASIGSKAGAYHVPGTDDLRGVPLDVLCNVLYNSKLMISVSSGPAHLASFCGTPHIVWSDRKPQKAIGGKTNKQRYQSVWSPFNSKVIFEDRYGWTPPVEIVAKHVKKILEKA